MDKRECWDVSPEKESALIPRPKAVERFKHRLDHRLTERERESESENERERERGRETCMGLITVLHPQMPERNRI